MDSSCYDSFLNSSSEECEFGVTVERERVGLQVDGGSGIRSETDGGEGGADDAVSVGEVH